MRHFVFIAMLSAAPLYPASSTLAATPTEQALADKAAFDARLLTARTAAVTLKGLADQTAHPDLSPNEQKAWTGQSKQLGTTAKKLFDMIDQHAGIKAPTVQQMAQMNMQFLALQEATQMESRKYQTLSNASARANAALGALSPLAATP